MALNQPKVLVDVRVTRMCNEGRMSFGVDRGFVDPSEQTTVLTNVHNFCEAVSPQAEI